MALFTFPKISFRNLFKRKEFDPTQMGSINDPWVEDVAGDGVKNITKLGELQNVDLPFEEKARLVQQKIDQYNSLKDFNA